jgi:uncharacterized protein YciI
MRKQALLIIGAMLFLTLRQAAAQNETTAPGPHYDGALAKSLGADERGMRAYVLVILKTGPNKVPDGPARKKMFEGHFANLQRLADEQKLVLAGPLDGSDGRRGIFVFATPDIAQARTYVATDPVIVNGEMAAEYHKFYGSAGLVMMNEIHDKIRQK